MCVFFLKNILWNFFFLIIFFFRKNILWKWMVLYWCCWNPTQKIERVGLLQRQHKLSCSWPISYWVGLLCTLGSCSCSVVSFKITFTYFLRILGRPFPSLSLLKTLNPPTLSWGGRTHRQNFHWICWKFRVSSSISYNHSLLLCLFKF